MIRVELSVANVPDEQTSPSISECRCFIFQGTTVLVPQYLSASALSVTSQYSDCIEVSNSFLAG
jgi:hypothetical protein